MKKNLVLSMIAIVYALVMPMTAVGADPSTPGVTPNTETIVLIRHGEKPKDDLGQLSSTGLNRALALPGVLIAKYGKPDFLFAPDPAVKNHDYSYVRPLATIEPTAIECGLPVNAQIGFSDIGQLQTELTKPAYASSVVYVAWEHVYLDQFAQNLVKSYGGDPSTVPPWAGSDYDTIFVIRLQHNGATTTATFTVDHEGLDGKLGAGFPVPAAK